MKIKIAVFSFFIVSLITVRLEAQQWKIKNYSAGFRVFEVDAIGNSPFTVARFLKQPRPYQTYINSINYNSIYGNPEISGLKTFYANIELQNTDPLLRFWKKWTVQAGILLTTRIKHDAGAIAYDDHYTSSNTTLYVYQYSLTNKQQFLGANMGLNRRFKISNRLDFLTGFHVQGSFAVTNYYKQRWDSSTFSTSTGWIRARTEMPDLKARNYFQWQAMIPLGIELGFKQKQFLIRLEAVAGVVGNQFRPKGFASREAHGVGMWLIHQPGSVKQ